MNARMHVCMEKGRSASATGQQSLLRHTPLLEQEVTCSNAAHMVCVCMCVCVCVCVDQGAHFIQSAPLSRIRFVGKISAPI